MAVQQGWLCPSSTSALDLSDPCTRTLYASTAPFAVAAALSMVTLVSWELDRTGVSSRLAEWVPDAVKAPFRQVITLEEAEAILAEEKQEDRANARTPGSSGNDSSSLPARKRGTWKTVAFTLIGLLLALTWLGVASYHYASTEPHQPARISAIVFPLCTALTWAYTALRAIQHHRPTVSYTLLILYAALFCGAILRIGGSLLFPDDEDQFPLGVEIANLTAVVIELGLLVSMPRNVPGDCIDVQQIGKTISPEDYTSLIKFCTFRWVAPLVFASTRKASASKVSRLEEDDIWGLPAGLRSRAVWRAFSAVRTPSVMRKLYNLLAPALVLDLLLTISSVCFQYGGVVFLKGILDAIAAREASALHPDASAEPMTWSTTLQVAFVTPFRSFSDSKNSAPASIHALPYIYALAHFSLTLLKALCDAVHLYWGRRAASIGWVGIGSGVYEKALKRKDFSGAPATGRGNSESKTTSKKAKGEDKEEVQNRTGPAGVGKIVNLMSGDANRLASSVSGLYFLYGAPLELVLASTLLYNLLGLSAFAGFGAILLGWPINTWISRRSIRIQKKLLAARDGRMGVLNEVVSSVKFIKFFAWEDKWIARALEAREVEMGWMVKARLNQIMFYALWTLAPIMVSVISFACYVFSGNELSVSVAFTSIALFNMVRTPLNVLPAWIVQLLQTRVAIQRVQAFLDEEEVDETVSSLKEQSESPDNEDETGLGLVHAYLKWNEAPQHGSTDDSKGAVLDQDAEAARSSGASANATSDVEAQSNSASRDPSLLNFDNTDEEDARFELRDISVRFPEGKLTVVTGPTASGKSALLLAVLGELTLQRGKILLSKDPSKVDENGHTHTISYASQTPWLQHRSIKANILFDDYEEEMEADDVDSDDENDEQGLSKMKSPQRNGYDDERYLAVLEACALETDLKQLEDGEHTEIGARGVSLSGGQKARVALARAVYSRSKYVLLDDPLSAVDSHTSRVLYEKLLRGPLLENRTVVLVTHHIDLVLPGAHYLIRMLDGRIDAQGTVADLQARGLIDDIMHDASVDHHNALQLHLGADLARGPGDVDESAEATPIDELENALDVPIVRGKGKGRQIDGGRKSKASRVVTGKEKGKGKAKSGKKAARKLVKDEHRETGGVKWGVYKSYLRASSYWIWAFLAVMVVVVQVLGAGEKLWITVWGDAYSRANGSRASSSSIPASTFVGFTSFTYPAEFTAHLHQLASHPSLPILHQGDGYDLKLALRRDELGDDGGKGRFGIAWPNASEHPFFYVGIYAGIGLLIAFANVVSVSAQYTAALRASRVLFKQLLTSVVRATFRFHDTTPQGRMLNRFGKDIETIDSSLAGSLQAVNTSLASFFAAIVIVAVVFPYFLIPAFFIGLAYRALAIGYLTTGRDLRRMESNTRSPIFSDFGEMLEGIVTVRAFSAERRFLNNLHRKIDLTTKMWYGFWMTNRWLLLNFDALGALAVLVTSLLAIATLSKGAGLAGLCITSAMTFTSSVYWACRFWTALELDLNSVERVVEYLELPQEPPAIIESNRPPAYWPSSTNNDALVRVENLVIKYAPDLPDVLHDVSFALRGGERIGLLGRTGSGKSTLAMSILRFVDPSGGRILIDGIDISKIGIHDLRSRVTFIPQDATLFSGTLRENLDPFGEHTDADVLDVLRRVHLMTDSTLTSRRTSREQSAASSRAASILNVEDSSSEGSSPRSATSDAPSTISAATSSTDVDPKAKIHLDTKVSAGGSNFSQGQRQLIAMARALLRKSAIVVLDEATSSIDFATDAKIQTTIREEFVGSLLLTVAHRLRTVIDYDRLIVLDKGEIVEFDTPCNLIQRENGTFRRMCLKSGTFAELEASARAKAEADAAAGAATITTTDSESAPPTVL